MNETEKIIEKALKEDIKTGDITTEIFVDKNAKFKGILISKDNGILCGIDFAEMCFKKLNSKARIKKLKKDGEFITKKEIIAEILSDRTILSAERTALNIIQRLSGIATKTYEFARLSRNYGVEVFDTRKTGPNFRIMEKYAVSCGGGTNHRFGLYDAFMIKDNHISSFKNIKEIEKKISIARRLHPQKEIEIEAESLKQVRDFIDMDIDVIMLDNMDLKTAKKAINLIRAKRKDIEIELSGGIDEKNFINYLKLRPDRISIGALTHSYKSLDISLEIERIK
ncbi:MAG: carboxylating nicotinate-nucleotide diphosphorylase [Elusimicrobiales bacterium]|jgi:nicotinate-nucleotide pyrophosphorylase (carboxylating)|nr:carboxylating nicotinate-nucleotide diphosphorylase [Elusimicrobiales bacterium]HOL62557.1 carboxylating nicotinate-nucleotide diphosphorylase [Elusimicrobiales bacterium]